MSEMAITDRKTSDSGKSLNLAQRMDRLPLTKYQRTLFLIIAMAWLFDSMDLMMLTFVLAPVAQAFKLAPIQVGFVGSASFVGMAVGGALAGLMADRIGRKAVFQVSMIIWGTGAFLCSVAPGYAFFLVARFILGFGMAAEYPVAQSMVSEIIPTRQRGKYVAILEGFWPLGYLVAGIVSLLLVPVGGWRLVFLATALPAIYVFVIRRAVPESPRWYEARGRLNEAETTMQYIENRVQEAHGKPLPEPAQSAIIAEVPKGGFALGELFTKKYRVRTIMAWAMWFFIMIGFYGISVWIGKILVDKGFTIQKSIEVVLTMVSIGVPGFFLAAYLVEKIGRKPSAVGFFFMCGVGAYFYGQATSNTGLLIAGGFMQFFFFGQASVMYAYTAEVFPTRARATGCGTSSTCGRIGALLGPSIVPLIMANYGVEAVFKLGGACYVVAALVVLILGPETKGRVLEDISG